VNATQETVVPAAIERRERGEPRPNSKIAAVIGLLSRSGGATLADLVAATAWLPHTTRAALTGLRKRGYVVTLDGSDRDRGSFYRIDPKPTLGAAVETKRAVEAE
jgi:DNA-binding IclR family transcriptional regulator